MSGDFFPSRPHATPTIYAYEDTNPQQAGMRRIGSPGDGRGDAIIKP